MRSILFALLLVPFFTLNASAQVSNPTSSQPPNGGYTVYDSGGNQAGTANMSGKGTPGALARYTPVGGDATGYAWDGSKYVSDDNSNIVLTFFWNSNLERWDWDILVYNSAADTWDQQTGGYMT